MKPICKKRSMIGGQIRLLRQWKGFSQENMADALGISLVTYGDIERGKTDISLTRLMTIAQCLNVSVMDMLIFNESPFVLPIYETESTGSVQPDKSV